LVHHRYQAYSKKLFITTIPFLAMRTRFLLLSIAAMLSALQISSCKDEGSGVADPPSTNRAFVRVVHASYDAPAVDVAVDGNRALAALTYTRLTNGYNNLTAGANRRITVTAANTTSPVVVDATTPLEAGKSYSVFAMGALANLQSNTVIVEDVRTPSTTANTARVRFVHASPDAPAIDIRVNASTTPAFTNASFKTATQYAAVPSGNTRFVITPAGSTNEAVVVDNVSLAASTVYTVIALGTFSTTDTIPFQVRVIVDNDASATNAGNTVTNTTFTAPPRILFAHASPNAPAVNFLTDTTTFNTTPLNYQDVLFYRSFTGGTRRFRFNVASNNATVGDTTFATTAGQNLSIFAADSVSRITEVILRDTLTAPSATQARVRFVHLSPNAPAVFVAGDTVSRVALFPARPFIGTSSAQASAQSIFSTVNAGTVNLAVRLASDSSSVLVVRGVTLVGGKIYTVFARGFVGATGAQALSAQIILHNP
jgi:hypothetical protein